MVRGEMTAVASSMTPAAFVSLHDAQVARRRPRRYRVVAQAVDGTTARSTVEFSGKGVYEMALNWELAEGAWRVVTATVVAGSVRLPWWRRLFGGDRAAEERPERRDLA
jgi:hypothetical protein